jgi:hypothetical protein
MKISTKVIDWLLETDNPPVCYLTLKNLLHLPESDSKVTSARNRLMGYSVTKEIIGQHQEFLTEEDRDYWKYTGKFWQVIFLGQFMADGDDRRIKEGLLRLLEHRSWVSKQGGQCLTANMLAAFMRLGFQEHIQVIKETESLSKKINTTKGIRCSAMDYSLLPLCSMALPKILLCLAEVQPQQRSETMHLTIRILTEQLLKNQIHIYAPGNRRQWQNILELAPKKADLPPGVTVKQWLHVQRDQFLITPGAGQPEPKKGWLKFGFPLHYNSDILEAMFALARLGTPMSEELKKPLEIIAEKMTPDGVWILENSLNGKMRADVEEKGKPSKWITYHALYVLNHFNIADIR